MPSEALDVTPLDLDEVEKWVFRTQRVPAKDLDPGLREAIMDVVSPIVEAVRTVERFSANKRADYIKAQTELDNELRRFNRVTMPCHNRGTLCTASAGARIYHIGYEVWVDYRGITQSDADCLPEKIKRSLYHRYLQGFQRLEEQRYSNPEAFRATLETTIQDALRKFKGQHLNYSTAEQIRLAILNCGLIDKASKIEIDRSNTGGYVFTIEVDHGPLHQKTLLNVSIG